MTVSVVRVGYMGVGMSDWLMSVPVAVLSRWHLVMRMDVMTIVMAMRMLVLQHLVFMLMSVRLGQVQDHTNQH